MNLALSFAHCCARMYFFHPAISEFSDMAGRVASHQILVGSGEITHCASQ